MATQMQLSTILLGSNDFLVFAAAKPVRPRTPRADDYEKRGRGPFFKRQLLGYSAANGKASATRWTDCETNSLASATSLE